MESPHQPLLSRTVAVSLLLLTPLSGCGPGDVDPEEAGDLAAEFEAGANNATDEMEAQILHDRANSFREVSEGNEAQEGRVKVIGE